MKNLVKSFAALAAILSFAACQKEIEGPKDEPKVTHKVTFVAGNPETKTSATIDGTAVNYTWKDTDATMVGEVDKFHVFENGVEADEVLANLESDGTMTITAEFDGEYPTEGTIYTGYFNTGVQAVQEADGMDYDQLSDVLIARATAANAEGNIPFQFKRLGAICEMNIKGLTAGTNLKRVIVEAIDENVYLAGSLVDGELVGNSKSIVINSLNEITSEVAKIRFVSLPVEGANLKVTVETTEDSETVSGTFYKKFGKAISFTEGDLKAFNVATSQVLKGDMWDYEFTEGIFTAVNQTKTLSEKEWTVSGTGNTGNGYFQKDANNRGEQFGSNANPFTTLTFSSEDFGESYFVKDIRVTATSGATPVALSVSVGGVTLKNGENTSASLSTTENTYVFDADYLLSGKIELTFNQTASTKKAMYVHEIAVNYVARCEAPAADVESGSEVVGGSKIELTSETEGASIYYTLDGEIPTVESSLYNSTDKVTMPNNDCTLKAIAVKDGMVNSTVAEFTYTLPTVADPKLSFKSGKIVATCTTEDAVIRYKIGGEDVADPTESDNVYDDNNKPSITANAYASIKAFKAGYHESQAVKAQYVAGAGITDVIDAEATSVGDVSEKSTSTWVTDFDITETVSGAVYRVHTMGTQGTTDALRFNANGFLNTTTSGGVAKKITITGANKAYSIYGGSSSFGTTKPSGTATGTLRVSNGTGSYEFTSEYEYIAIVGTESSSAITSITIEWGEPKADRDLAFFNGDDKVTDALNATFGSEFTAPTLKDGETVVSSGVTYSSNNESVATVNETTGVVTIKNHGTAQITANVAADETHKAGSASYTINVVHVLSTISLADDSAQPTELYQNTAFNFTGIKVNANYNDGCVVDITSQLTSSNFTGYNMANLGEQTVTITYEGKTTSYTLNVVSAAALHNITYTGASDGKGNSVSGLAQAEEGDEVTLSINLASGYYLTTLTVDGEDKMSSVADNKVTFTMGDHDVAVVATFSNLYTVTLTQPTENGTVKVAGTTTASQTFAYGATVNVVAEPADGYELDEWTVTGATLADPSAASTSFTITSDVTITASFKVELVPDTFEIKKFANSFWGTSYSGSNSVSANSFTLEKTKNSVSFVLKNGTSTNSYVNDTETRAYNGYSLKITAPEGGKITGLSFSTGKWAVPECDNGEFSASPNTTWSGNASSVTLSFTGTCEIRSITVTGTGLTLDPIVLSSISVKTAPTKILYTEGDTFDPAGLKITKHMSDDTDVDVAYADEPSNFSFNPGLSTELKTTDKNVSISYGDKSVDQPITVNLAGSSALTYTLTITGNDFNTTSYVANNGDHEFTAVCTTDNTKTMTVNINTTAIMKNSNNIQWQKNNGILYNKTDLGSVTDVTVTSTAGSFTTTYGSTMNPTSGSTKGTPFFRIKVGSATGTVSKIVIIFTK